MTDRMAEVEKAMELQEERANKDIDKFTQSLAADPGYAFEWADVAIQAAASVDEVAAVRRILGAVSSGTLDVADFYVSVRCEIAHWLPSHLSGSTSPSRNIMSHARAVIATVWFGPDSIERSRLQMAVRNADLQ